MVKVFKCMSYAFEKLKEINQVAIVLPSLLGLTVSIIVL